VKELDETHAADDVGALRAEIAALREELDEQTRRASRALASYQQHALTMEIVRQQNEELDEMSQELLDAKRSVEERAVELEERNKRLRASERENVVLIERLKETLKQLSTPILHVRPGVLALPLIGAVDEERSSQILETALGAVVEARARVVILDVTGVEAIDPQTASHFLTLARGVRMLGAECILSGVQPMVAQTLVTNGLELGGLVTARNLQTALEVTRTRGLA
jgi:anti-anti-sigma regulatory factor